jgi:acetyl esterase/lipase
MKTFFSLLFLIQFTLLIFIPVRAQNLSKSSVSFTSQEILLWPKKAPGSEYVDLTENIIERSQDTLVHDRIINNISTPSLEMFIPENPNGSAVVICPGGAYSYLSYDKEGLDIAKWFNTLGFTAFILKYRLPAEGHRQGTNVPLMDAQRAVRFIRAHAGKWGIDTQKIGIIGFSAGGHLASTCGTMYERKVYEPIDSVDQESARPDFMILMYPVISMEDGITHAGSKKNLLGDSPDLKTVELFSTQTQVDQNTPPTFLVHATDDRTVIPENSLLFYYALQESHIPCEMHIFEKGGHGFGIRQATGPLSKWPQLCEKWLKLHNLN